MAHRRENRGMEVNLLALEPHGAGETKKPGCMAEHVAPVCHKMENFLFWSTRLIPLGSQAPEPRSTPLPWVSAPRGRADSRKAEAPPSWKLPFLSMDVKPSPWETHLNARIYLVVPDKCLHQIYSTTSAVWAEKGKLMFKLTYSVLFISRVYFTSKFQTPLVRHICKNMIKN